MEHAIQRLGVVLLFLVLLLPFIPVAEALPPTPRLAAAPLDVIISEIGWGGTAASTADEWIELYNNTSAPIDLTGWTLQAADGTPSITLIGVIPAYGYFLLERSDDNTIIDIRANLTYTGALGNTGEALTLRDAASNVVDTANGDGGPWPAGTASPNYQSMERIDPLSPDDDANWGSNTMSIRNGHDALWQPINGTPKLRNSVSAPAADLFICKVGPAQAAAGSDIVYALTLGNWGNLTATSTLLTDTLPAGATFVSQVSPYPYSQPLPGIVVWEVGTVPFTLTAFSITITAHIAITASGTLTNEVQVATPVVEVTPENNTGSAATVVQALSPDLAVGKAGPATTHAGELLTYTLAVTNIGQLEAPAVRLTDTLPAGVAFLYQDSPYTYTRPAPDTVVWEIGNLLPDGAAHLFLYAQVLPTATGTLTNTAYASTPSAEGNLDNNTASWATHVLLPNTGKVVINEVAWAGTLASTADEWIELYNASLYDIDLSGWTLSDGGDISITLSGVIPAGGYFLLERTDDTTIPDIPADQIYTGALGNTGEALTLRDAGGNVVDTANGDGGGWPAGTASPNYQTMERIDPSAPDSDANWGSNTTWIRNGHDNGGNPLNGTPKQRNSLSWPDITLSKTAPSSTPVGSPLIYHITLVNQGPLAAPSVLLTDTLPAGFLYETYAAPYPCTLAGATFSCQAGEVPPASQNTIVITGSVALTASGTLLNVVWATTAITEVTGTNNLAQAATAVQPAYPDLAVGKAGPATTHAGELLTYTLAVTNIGQLEAPSVRLTDTLPAGVAFLYQDSPYTYTRPAPDTVVWEIGNLLPDGAARLFLYAQVLPTATGTLTNTAYASTPSAEGNLDNNTASWATHVLLPNTGKVVINEVAWAGTVASADDEWIELYNASLYDIDLSGWTLSDGGDISIILSGVIPAGGYFLLERTDDNTIIDIPADQIYTGALGNTGEALTLRDAGGNIVDTANGDGGPWPAGDNTTKRTMERIDPTAPDSDANWASNDMVHRNGHDAGGNPINGTPKALNSASYPPLPSADLRVAKTGPLTATPGMTLTYFLAITNAGTLDAPAARLTDTLPAGMAFIFQSSPYSFTQLTTGTLVWDLGTLPAAASAGVVLYARVEPYAAGVLTNRITATTVVTEANPADNTAFCTTTVVYPGEAHLLIEAVLYDGYVLDDHDEAVRLVNVGSAPADLSGWKVCDAASGGSCATLPTGATLAPGRRIWLAWYGDAFFSSFGFLPDYEKVETRPEVPNLGGSWPNFSNTGDEAVLRDPSDAVVDTVVFEGGSTSTPGWSGPALEPYAGSGNFGAEGQILQRILDEDTGLPIADTNTAADWFQYPGDALYGRRVCYPGWDLDAFFRPLSITQEASVTVAIAPDNAGEAFLSAIALAQERIEAEFYELENYDIIQALVGKAQSGVSVTLLLEGEVAGGISDQELWACQQLEAAGGACWFMFNESSVRIYDRYTNMHSKLMLLDRRWALISSQNPTAGGLPTDDKSDGTWGSRGVFLLTDAPAVVERALAIFQADFDPAAHLDLTRWSPTNSYGYGPPPPGFQPITTSGGITSSVVFTAPLRLSGAFGFELFSAPEAALRQSDALLGLLSRAGPGDSVDVEQMYEYRAWGMMPDRTPAPNLRLEAYIAAARRGATVRILLNSGSFGESFYDISKNLETVAYVNGLARREGLNLQARLGDPTRYGIHNKMVLVRLGDRGYAHIGSINGSETSSKVNRELAVQIASNAVYDYLEEMFEWDWYHSNPIYLPLVFKHYLMPADHLLVSEVLYDPEGLDAGKEWVELYNPTNHAVDLSGWTLGDAVALGEYGSGRYLFPTGTVIPARTVWTIAAQAQDVGFHPTFEFLIDPLRDDPSVPNMIPAGTWDGFGFALGNEGDEVILLDAAENPVDVLVYGAGAYPGVIPHPGVSAAGHSLERRPADRDTDDCSADFFDRYPPTPGVVP